jgi:hypothetical protein
MGARAAGVGPRCFARRGSICGISAQSCSILPLQTAAKGLHDNPVFRSDFNRITVVSPDFQK